MASATQQLITAIQNVLARHSLAMLATVVAAETGVGAKLLVTEDGATTGTLGDEALDTAMARHAPVFLGTRAEARTYQADECDPDLAARRAVRVLCERIEPEPRLVICGAGHVGAALARLALVLNYQTALLDDRAAFLTRARFPDERLRLTVASGWDAALRAEVGNGRGVAVAVVTRGHNEDEECMRAILAAQPDYVGMIGSRRRTNIVLQRLRELGFSEARLREVRAPVGLNLGSVSPEEVALAILAEIVAHRRGGTGAPLSDWRRQLVPEVAKLPLQSAH